MLPSTREVDLAQDLVGSVVAAHLAELGSVDLAAAAAVALEVLVDLAQTSPSKICSRHLADKREVVVERVDLLSLRTRYTLAITSMYKPAYRSKKQQREPPRRSPSPLLRNVRSVLEVA